jgi:hypothetical protein
MRQQAAPDEHKEKRPTLNAQLFNAQAKIR